MKTFHLVYVIAFLICYCRKNYGQTSESIDDNPGIQELFDKAKDFKKEHDRLQLKFSDYGSGMATGENRPGKSFGLVLIEKLVKQLNGKMDFKIEDGWSDDFSFRGL